MPENDYPIPDDNARRGFSERAKDLRRYLVDTAASMVERPAMRSGWHGEPERAATDEEIYEDIVRESGFYLDRWVMYTPSLYLTARLEHLNPATQHRDTVSGFLDGDAQTLFLAGPIGTGKSHAAWSLCHRAVAASPRRQVLVRSLQRLLVDMRPDGDDTAFSRACEVGLLVLDDLAAAKPTDWATEQIYSIAEGRASNERRTVITTNASYDTLVGMWGEPTMDRFRHRSINAVFTGESRRERMW